MEEELGRTARAMESNEGRSNRENDGKGSTSMKESDCRWMVDGFEGGPTCKTVNGEARAAFSMINPVPPTPKI